MTDRKAALQALLDAVETGEVVQALDAVAIWPTDALSMAVPWLDACKASQGSLDAAMALHEAVLPGWEWRLRNNRAWVWAGITCFGGDETEDTDMKGLPARAWLAAILKALIAEAGND